VVQGANHVRSQPGADKHAAARRSGTARGRSRRSLKNWRVRSRLLALIAVPTLIAVTLGGVRIFSSARSALGYERVVALASLGGKITALAQALEDERDTTAGYIAHGRPPDMAHVVQHNDGSSDYWARQVIPLARAIGGGYPAETRAQAATVLSRINGLTPLRTASLSSKLPPLVVIQDYSRAIDDLLALDDEIAQGSGDSTLADTVRALGLASRMKEQASQQRAILDLALTRGQFLPGELTALEAAQAQEASNLAVFNTSATVGQRQLYRDTVTGSLVTRAGNQELSAISLAARTAPAAVGGSLRSDPTTAADWYGAMSDVIGRMRSVESSFIGTVMSRSAALRESAITSAAAGGGAVLLVLLISVVFTALVARSMVGPLRQLRTGALDVAGARLPEMVRRLGDSDGEGAPPDVAPIDVDSADEIGEVARAFDQVHREALRLAANEALLRGNVNAMFVNLSRRSQSLVERQLELIDELEQGEEDSGRLGSLFRMDHLATRMRRNSENLLVLAGHEGGRQRSRPVALVDVLRAAVSEIEQYSRVHLDAQPGAGVRGQAAGDVVHLVSELVENATAFSPVEAPVTVSGRTLNGGGVVLEITDRGIGMAADDMAHANWRLDNPPVVDVAVSRRMGLFVVGRLAARHGIRVRLRPGTQTGTETGTGAGTGAGTGSGLTALIWLPDELVVREALGGVPESWAAKPAGAGGPRVAEILDIPAAAPRGGLDTPLVPGRNPAEAVAAARAGRTGPQPVLSAPVPSQAPPRRGALPVRRPRPAPLPSVPSQPRAPELNRPLSPGSRPAGLPGSGPPGASGPPPGVPAPPRETIARSAAFTGIQRDRVIASAGAGAGASGNGKGNRLPIFESVESDWFRQASGSRHGRHTGTEIDSLAGPGSANAQNGGNWTSPGDEGWRAAEAARDPASGGTTEAGLPKRVPRANLVPGSASGPGAGGFDDGRYRARVPEPAVAGAARPAQEIRERLASFQRGARAGHAAGRRGQFAAEEDEWEANA
jgi:signal transduction histidine kinase